MTPRLLPESSPRGSNLAFALLCLPRQRRDDAFLFYRFCKTIDEIADACGSPPDERRALLFAWKKAIDSELPDGLEETVARNGIDRRHLHAIVDGCASDIEPQPFETIADLESYCWKVACAVGLASIKIFGCTDPRSETYAVHLGHALQLVNILRDVGDDASRGRVYIPEEDLRRHGLSRSEILSGKPDRTAFLALMEFEASRARTRLAAAAAPRADFHALLPARIMGAVYEKILSDLELAAFPVFERRVSLGTAGKLAAAASAFLQRRP